MTYQELYKPLLPLYGEGEAKALVRYVLEEEFGLTLADICCSALDALTDAQKERLHGVLNRLEQGEPVQYILGKAWFCDRPFQVQPGVLIPRPETEELCRWIIESEAAHACASLRVLDLCTGSGCIAVTLALSLRNAQVSACDISPVALKVAAGNARRMQADVAVECRDVLQQVTEVQPRWHLMVSNPPYVCESERAGMHRNVLAYEPAEALFVPDDHPLLFYRSICLNAVHELLPGGWLYLEINPLFANQMQVMLSGMRFEAVEVRKDSFGRQRFVRARKGR
ncbi:MAG: peptide chain release factor N(5)-glutamine methyltransferase [Prevotella sp.]